MADTSVDNMNEFLREVSRIRSEAQKSRFWDLNIDALIESNSKCFEGPISRTDMEECYNFVLDQYDPHVLIRTGYLKDADYEDYVNYYADRNPFIELIELDDQRNIKDVVLYTTDDREFVAEFLSKKYKWKESS